VVVLSPGLLVVVLEPHGTKDVNGIASKDELRFDPAYLSYM